MGFISRFQRKHRPSKNCGTLFCSSAEYLVHIGINRTITPLVDSNNRWNMSSNLSHFPQIRLPIYPCPREIHSYLKKQRRNHRCTDKILFKTHSLGIIQPHNNGRFNGVLFCIDLLGWFETRNRAATRSTPERIHL